MPIVLQCIYVVCAASLESLLLPFGILLCVEEPVARAQILELICSCTNMLRRRIVQMPFAHDLHPLHALRHPMLFKVAIGINIYVRLTVQETQVFLSMLLDNCKFLHLALGLFLQPPPMVS
jgi:hypothetical protein